MRCCPSTSQAGLQAFTLLEVSIALGLSVLAFGACAAVLMYTCETTAVMANQADMTRLNMAAMDLLTSDIRQASSITSYSNNQLTVQAVDISSGNTNTLYYIYDPVGLTLSRGYQGATNTLLTGMVSNSFQLAMYPLNTNGGISTNTTTNATLCRAIQVTWNCKRSYLGVGELQGGQSTQIVMRK